MDRPRGLHVRFTGTGAPQLSLRIHTRSISYAEAFGRHEFVIGAQLKYKSNIPPAPGR